MALIAGLPVFEGTIEDDECGMMRISLVDAPAVMRDFQTFAKEDARFLKYDIANEEKRIVFGVIMRANFPIYREDGGMAYWILYKPNTIRVMAEKYLAEGRQNNFDLMHDGKEIGGVDCVQLFIKDTAKGISPIGFDDIEDGSLFGEFHITDDALWSQIKEGTFRGFSIEIWNRVRPISGIVSEEKIPSELYDWLCNFSKDKTIKMGKKIKSMLAKMVGKFGMVTTDNGILLWDGDGELEVGMGVFVEDAEGNRVDAADGNYTIEDGKIIVVVDGKVAEIKDNEAEVAPAEGDKGEEMSKKKTCAEGEEPKGSEGEGGNAELDGLKAELAGLKAELAGLKEELAGAKEEIGGLKEELADIKKLLGDAPAADPAHDEFKAERKAEKGNRIRQIMSAKIQY